MATKEFVCSSCDAAKPIAGARSIEGALWCADCGASADAIDEWVRAGEPTREISRELLSVLVERTLPECDDEPTLVGWPAMNFDDDPTRVVAVVP
jgi:hypothetical protein